MGLDLEGRGGNSKGGWMDGDWEKERTQDFYAGASEQKVMLAKAP